MTNETTTLLAGSSAAEPDASPTFADRIPAQSQVLYGDPQVAHRGALREFASASAEGMATTEQTQAAVAELAPILGRYATDEQEGKALSGAFASAARKAPSAEQIASWREASLAELRHLHGSRAGDVLQATAALVRKDPALAKKLAGGLGNHPDVIRVLSRRAAR